MPYALLLWLWVSVVAMFLTISSGLHLFPSQNFLRLHVIMALSSVTIALFAHTMTMFYFIGIGKKIKEFTANWDAPTRDRLRAQVIAMKRKIFPPMTMVCVVLMVAFILGGAADAGRIPRPVHAWVSYFAVVYHVHVVVRETIYLLKNIHLIDEVNDLGRRRADPTEASPA